MSVQKKIFIDIVNKFYNLKLKNISLSLELKQEPSSLISIVVFSKVDLNNIECIANFHIFHSSESSLVEIKDTLRIIYNTLKNDDVNEVLNLSKEIGTTI